MRPAPMADERRSTSEGRGRPTERAVRTGQVLQGYSRLPGLHRGIEVEREVKYMRRGEAVEETREVRYAATNASPRRYARTDVPA